MKTILIQSGVPNALQGTNMSMTGFLHKHTVNSHVWFPVVVPASELFAVELSTLLRSVVHSVNGTVFSVAQFVGPGGAFTELPSIHGPEWTTSILNEPHQTSIRHEYL